MGVATTQIASLPPISDPSPTPAPSAVDSSPNTGQSGQNAPNASIKGSIQNQKQL